MIGVSQTSLPAIMEKKTQKKQKLYRVSAYFVREKYVYTLRVQLDMTVIESLSEHHA